MQQWSRFQSQSKTLYKKILFVIFTSIILFSGNTQAFGESSEQIDISKYLNTNGNSFRSDFGEVIQTSKIIFEFKKDTTVHVKHVIIGSTWSPDEPKLIKTLPGKHTNLEVTDEDGDYLRPIGFVGETFEESEYIIAGQKPHSGYDLVAEYDLENFLELGENNLWKKQSQFPHDVIIYFDNEIDLVFVNSRPVDISNAGGINCVGCDVVIEFFNEKDPIVEKVTRNENKIEEISKFGEEFAVEFLSDGKISDVKFIDDLNYLSLNLNKENQLVVMKIPLDLLLSPYHVYFTESDQEVLAESDQIRKTEFGQNVTATHANLSFRGQMEGLIHVVGATEMEHEEQLLKIEKFTPKPTSKTDVDTINQDDEVEDIENDELYKKWENSNGDINNDNTIIFIIIGIVFVIIVGVIVKLKKN